MYIRKCLDSLFDNSENLPTPAAAAACLWTRKTKQPDKCFGVLLLILPAFTLFINSLGHSHQSSLLPLPALPR